MSIFLICLFASRIIVDPVMIFIFCNVMCD
jgi:hypothetical protein